MRGVHRVRLPNDLWAEIKEKGLQESDTGNALLIKAIHLAYMEIARKMEGLGLNKSDRKQRMRLFRHDQVAFNGHPFQDTIESLDKATDQASDEYKTYVLTKHIRMALNKGEEGK
jgi:hypothetical protein